MQGLLFAPVSFPSRRARIAWEERTNAVTHYVAAVLSLFGAVWLTESASQVGDEWLTAGCAIYGASLVLVYAMSALSHSFRRGWWKHTFRTLDQVCIFLLISGNYTPVGLTIARAWWPVLAAMWVLSFAGIATKLFVTGMRNVPVWFYVAIGWMPLLATEPIFQHFDLAALSWIFVGGACYTVGTLFLANDGKHPYFHPLWHLLVMAGSACHFILMQCYLLPVVAKL